MINKRFNLIIWAVIIALSSCIPNKRVILLQNETNFANDSLITQPYTDYQLQIGDNLRINVGSSDEKLTQIFQNTGGQMAMQGGQMGGDINYFTGYTIDPNGMLELPLIGNLPLAGLTLMESKSKIESAIREYILDAYVTVSLAGIRFTALGEFNSPGQQVAIQSRLTIMEAIAQAGDLTILANRSKLLLIRQYPEGVKTHELDLTNRALLQSPFYFIQPGDVLYTEPLPVRQWGTGITGVQTFTTVLSIISTTLVLIFTLGSLQ